MKNKPTFTEFLKIVAAEQGFKLYPYQKQLLEMLEDDSFKQYIMHPINFGYKLNLGMYLRTTRSKNENII